MQKTSHIQIRVTEEEKTLIRAFAESASMDISSWVISQAINKDQKQLHLLFEKLTKNDPVKNDWAKLTLAELNDFLYSLPKERLRHATLNKPMVNPPLIRNNKNFDYALALVELALSKHNLEMPQWIFNHNFQHQPVFASKLESLRLHLLLSSPVALRRRNIFADTSLGGRV